MLSILMLAFGGSLALKAFEERQFADNTILTQQAREAEALAGHIRADLVASRARMEGLLLTGASLEAIRRGVKFDAVAERSPPEGAWAQLADKSGVRVFAQNSQGRWISGLRSKDSVLPEALDGRAFHLVPSESIPASARFETVDFERSAVACAPVENAGIAACVFRPAPLFGMGDLNRLIIYTLLLTAPLLAVFGLVGVIRRVEREKNDAEAKLAAAPTRSAQDEWTSFEVAGVFGLWRWDPTNQLLTIGPEACALLGANHAGAMTLDEFTSVVNEDARRRVRETLETPGDRQVSVTFQGVGRVAGRHFELMGGVTDGMFSGAILNVTDRVQAQLVSRRAEALARTALDAHPGPFALWDSRKRLTHWNAAFARVFNLDKDVAQAGASYDLVMAELAKFVRVERPLGDDANAREMLLLSDSWIRLVDRRTSSDGLITVGVDISALKRQEANLQRSERRLRSMVEELQRAKGQAQELAEKYAEAKGKAERASQAKGAFLGNMSHELRTPLNHINGFAEMMANEIYGPLGSERYKEYAEDIVQAAKHLEEMINDILDMSKFEAGKMRLSAAQIDPVDAVDGAVKLARRRAADREVALMFDPDDDVPDISGDHRAIKQMTFNLITNAIKFTDPGGEIRVTVTEEAQWVVIRVADTGIGISPEDLPRLAQPFEQVTTPEAKERNVRGTGLGLALTKSFAEMHGGRIAIESELGKGTTVSIFLPIGKTAAAAGTTPERTRSRETA
jgi:two-component system cell cycle sensor histidine kinase PleC